jgi:hypothetical protein
VTKQFGACDSDNSRVFARLDVMNDSEEGPALGPGDIAEPEEASTSGMDPNHPLLHKAQQTLKSQLVNKRLRVEGELRAKQTQLQVRPGRCSV